MTEEQHIEWDPEAREQTERLRRLDEADAEIELARKGEFSVRVQTGGPGGDPGGSEGDPGGSTRIVMSEQMARQLALALTHERTLESTTPVPIRRSGSDRDRIQIDKPAKTIQIHDDPIVGQLDRIAIAIEQIAQSGDRTVGSDRDRIVGPDTSTIHPDDPDPVALDRDRVAQLDPDRIAIELGAQLDPIRIAIERIATTIREQTGAILQEVRSGSDRDRGGSESDYDPDVKRSAEEFRRAITCFIKATRRNPGWSPLGDAHLIAELEKLTNAELREPR